MIGRLLRAGRQAAVGALPFAFSTAPALFEGQSRQLYRAGLIGRALLLAALGGAAFLVMLAAGDSVFERVAGSFFTWDISQVTRRIVWAGLFAWPLTGVLQGSTTAPRPFLGGIVRVPSLNRLDVVSVLGTLNAVFLAYMAVQTRVLFGGSAYVSQTTGLTLAEYARRGFFAQGFTLVVTLGAILAIRGLYTDSDEKGERQFAWLSRTLMLLTIPLIGSAVMRMIVYVSAFGLSTERLYTLIVMAWAAAVMVWFATTVLRGSPRSFALGVVVSAWVTLLGVNIANPDAIVVRANLARAAAGKEFDFMYAVRRQSTDAMPAAIAAFEGAVPQVAAQLERTADKCQHIVELVNRLGNPNFDHIATWNFGRARALRFESRAKALRTRLQCDAWTAPRVDAR